MARQVFKRDQHGVAFLKEALQKPALPRIGLGVGLKQTVDGLATACVQAGVKQAAVVVEHQRQAARRGLVYVALGQKHRAAKRKRQVVLEDAVAGTPVLGVGEIDQAVVARLGAKRKVVDIAAQGAWEFHAVSNPFNYQRADGLILYGRSAVVTHNVIAPKLFREIGARAVSRNEVLDPGVVLVVFGLGAVGQLDRSADKS